MAIGLKIIDGDVNILPSGKLDTIEESEKAARDFVKMMRTDVESFDDLTEYYRYNPKYGNLLSRLIAQGLGRLTIIEVATSLLQTSIQNYLSLQESRNNLSAGEIIINVSYDVAFNIDEPSVLIVPVSITTAEGLTYNLGEFEERIA